jgi:hypothetical protein
MDVELMNRARWVAGKGFGDRLRHSHRVHHRYDRVTQGVKWEFVLRSSCWVFFGERCRGLAQSGLDQEESELRTENRDMNSSSGTWMDVRGQGIRTR